MKWTSLIRVSSATAIVAVAAAALADSAAQTPTLATQGPTPTATSTSFSIGDGAIQAADGKKSDKKGDDSSKSDKSDCGKGKAAGCGGGLLGPLDKTAKGAYKGLFYDNNFDYLCDPCYSDWHLGERMKRLGVGQAITVDVGGQYRARVHNERGIRNGGPAVGGVTNGLGLTGLNDDFLLHRTRVYMNAEIGNRLRFYGEVLDAFSNYENLGPRPIEENRFEMQNLFLDMLVMDAARGTLTARVGRQELLYGNQRMVSPLDWANTRRTFDAAKLMWKGDNWDVDGFWSSYAVRKNPDYLRKLDPGNGDQQMYGMYSTYKGLCRDKVDFFWLAKDNYTAGYKYDTIGTRYWGDCNNWLYETELAYQFGTNTDGSGHSAGAATFGFGRKMSRLAWNPTVWLYYDWASGSNTGGNGFDHYFPLAHKYLGFMDLYARKNIEDANFLLTLSPQERVKLLAWFHVFRLQNINDVPYNLNNSAYAGLAPGTSVSRDLGSELDLILSVTLTERMDILFGYSHFWAGDYYTAPGSSAPVSGDADFAYTQFTVNF